MICNERNTRASRESVAERSTATSPHASANCQDFWNPASFDARGAPVRRGRSASPRQRSGTEKCQHSSAAWVRGPGFHVTLRFKCSSCRGGRDGDRATEFFWTNCRQLLATKASEIEGFLELPGQLTTVYRRTLPVKFCFSRPLGFPSGACSPRSRRASSCRNTIDTAGSPGSPKLPFD